MRGTLRAVSFLARYLQGYPYSPRSRCQESSMLDVLYIVIGVVAFAVTVLYLPACDRL